MELQDVKSLLQVYLTELKCELTGWDKSIPLDTVRRWVKKVELRILKQIKE